MIEVIGAFNTAVCYTGELEEAAVGQIKAVCDQSAFADCKIRIMPDVHAGICFMKITLIRIKPTWNHPGNVSLISPATLQTGTVNRKRKAFRLPCGRLKCHKSKRLNIFLQNEPVLTTS